MRNGIRAIVIALFFATAFFHAVGAVRAEMVNLECCYAKVPNDCNYYWIDFDKKTVTSQSGDLHGHPAPEQGTKTAPVDVSQTEFKFTQGFANIAIDRTTGVMNLNNSGQSFLWQCAKGSFPFPENKF